MLARTDKYYDEVGDKPLETTIQTVRDALRDSGEHYYMSEREIVTLARILVWRKDGNDDGGMYEHTVDFLWMGWRIGQEQKYRLLELLEG